jgi:hypothetical protein
LDLAQKIFVISTRFIERPVAGFRRNPNNVVIYVCNADPAFGTHAWKKRHSIVVDGTQTQARRRHALILLYIPAHKNWRAVKALRLLSSIERLIRIRKTRVTSSNLGLALYKKAFYEATKQLKRLSDKDVADDDAQICLPMHTAMKPGRLESRSSRRPDYDTALMRLPSAN